jgi:hypothetical protein
MSVGVTKDYKLKLRNLHASYTLGWSWNFEVYYESRKRELQRRLINEGRCDERLKVKVEESTCLTYTGLNDKTN